MTELHPTILVATVSVILAVGAVLLPALALWQRLKSDKGIGWQFIRFTVIASTLPITGVLALNGVLTEAVAAIIGAAVGYAFGHTSDKPANQKSSQDASGT